jgi:hypothetical protein
VWGLNKKKIPDGAGKAQLENEQGLNALLLTGQGLKIKSAL